MRSTAPISAGRLRLLLAPLLVAACATTAPPPEEPFRPFQFARQSAPLEESPPARPAEARPLPQVRLDATLIRFAAVQRELRLATPKGQGMPDEARQAWIGLLAEIDRFLRQRVETTVPLDVVRGRVAMDAELEMDFTHYGELPPGLQASVRARTMAMGQRLAEVRRLQKPARPQPTQLVWPIDDPVLTSPYGTRRDPFTGGLRQHLGIDIQAEHGQLVQAAAPGVVVRAEWAGGHGLHVEVQHADGLVTRYSHLSRLLVVPGIEVPAKGPLGLAGSTGRSTGPHLHFEVWRHGQSLDPLTELTDPAVERLLSGNMGN